MYETKQVVITEELIKLIKKKRVNNRSSKDDAILEAWDNGIRTLTYGTYVRNETHLINGWWLPIGVAWEEHVHMNKVLGREVKPYRHNKIITNWYLYTGSEKYKEKFMK